MRFVTVKRNLRKLEVSQGGKPVMVVLRECSSFLHKRQT